MNFIQELYANPVVHSIGWTLLHACWQITLIAMLLKLVLKSAEKYSTNFAYGLTILSLICISLWSGYTFSQQYQHFDQAIKLAPIEAELNTEKQLTIATKSNRYSSKPKVEETPQSWNDQLIKFERYLPFLVILWLVGTIFLILKFIGGWLQIRRLRREAISPVETFWLDRLETLKHKIGIQKNIGFFSSALVNEPVTMGHLKPIILVPIGMFANLTPDMVEALLLHELAHIKRSDYLVNIIQSLLEIIFFFHPAIWWISKNIREIREHACDDMAVRACQDPLLYAKTLTHLQSSFLTTKIILAMSATGNTGSFTTRIKRLFGYSESKPRSKKSLAFSSLLFTGLLLFAFTNPLKETNSNNGFPEQITPSEAMLFVITPSTTPAQLDKISAAFSDQNVVAEFTETTYSSLGILESIRADFRLPDNSTSMIHIQKLINLTVSLDWDREKPIDLRGNGEKQSIVLPSEGDPASDFTYPYINTFDKPSMIGDVGFKKDENNEAVLTANLSDEKTRFFLNGESITKDQLNAKKLAPKEVHSMHRLNANQLEKKYNKISSEPAYEIYTKDKKEKKGWWPFEKDKNTRLKVHDFKVLHKAELRSLNKKPEKLSIAGGGVSISADNCDVDNKAFHVLNDRVMEVPDGFCYPPEIAALTEVDSFFILNEKLATKIYGIPESASAYVYYYKHKKEQEGIYVNTKKDASEPDEKTKAIISDALKHHSFQGSFQELEIPNATTTNPDKNNYDIIVISPATVGWRAEFKTPLCFLNDEKLAPSKVGEWPIEISEISEFDSIILISGETALGRYADAGKNDVWLFYKDNSAQEAFPELLKSEQETNKPNMLHVVNEQIVFPEGDEKTPALVEALRPEDILDISILIKNVAIEKYGDIGKNGVMEITTNAAATTWFIEEDFKVSPNPIHETAKVSFTLLKKKQVQIKVYDQSGKAVATLANRKMKKGMQELIWEPGDLPSGIYYITVSAEGGKPFTKSVVLQKGG